jgi:hypothetical protein
MIRTLADLWTRYTHKARHRKGSTVADTVARLYERDVRAAWADLIGATT